MQERAHESGSCVQIICAILGVHPNRHTPICAQAGHKAIELFKNHRPSLVVMDWTPGTTDQHHVAQAPDAGADDYPAKPFRCGSSRRVWTWTFGSLFQRLALRCPPPVMP